MNVDILNKWLTAVQSVAIITGVVVAVWQLFEISEQNRLQLQSLKQGQQTASADLVLRLRQKLDDSRYVRITEEIQSHDQKYPLLSPADGGKEGGKFRDIEIEGYIGNFEDIGYLVQDHLISTKMAYDHFSYDVEKAWCNGDIHRIVLDARKADKSSTATADPIYGNLESLAQSFLSKEKSILQKPGWTVTQDWRTQTKDDADGRSMLKLARVGPPCLPVIARRAASCSNSLPSQLDDIAT